MDKHQNTVRYLQVTLEKEKSYDVDRSHHKETSRGHSTTDRRNARRFSVRSKQIRKEAAALALQRYDKDQCSQVDRDRSVFDRGGFLPRRDAITVIRRV